MSSFQAAPFRPNVISARWRRARARPDPRPPRTRRPAAARWPRPAARARRRAGLPREIAIPILPADLRDAGLARLARQAQIAHRHDPRTRLIGTVAIGEGVKLLDVTERMMRLRLDPGAQPACSERCDSSNGPAGKARASSVVSTLGSPLVTATSTATARHGRNARRIRSRRYRAKEDGKSRRRPGPERRGSRPAIRPEL